MRIAFYGNVCNNFYTLAKTLRDELQLDAHLYLNPKVDFQNLPESDNPELLNNYPNWIHLHEKWDPLLFLKKFDKAFIQELNKFDLVFLSDSGVILSPFIKSKTIFYITGSDLFRTPFPLKWISSLKGLTPKLSWFYRGIMQRIGIRKTDIVISQAFYPFSVCLNELNISPKKVSNGYFPILINTDLLKKTENAWGKIDAYNKQKLDKFKFIIFHPSRLLFKKTQEADSTWQLKGNDVLLYAFKNFIDKYSIKDACIAMPDRLHSVDKPEAMKIINDLGIEQYIVWLKPTNPEGFPRRELINFYSIANVVADDFNYGMFGSVVIEGMACEKPVLSFVEEHAMQKMYPWHPIISTKDPKEIADKLADLYVNKNLEKELGLKSREWVETFHSINNGSQIYLSNLRRDFHDIIPFNL